MIENYTSLNLKGISRTFEKFDSYSSFLKEHLNPFKQSTEPFLKNAKYIEALKNTKQFAESLNNSKQFTEVFKNVAKALNNDKRLIENYTSLNLKGISRTFEKFDSYSSFLKDHLDIFKQSTEVLKNLTEPFKQLTEALKQFQTVHRSF